MCSLRLFAQIPENNRNTVGSRIGNVNKKAKVKKGCILLSWCSQRDICSYFLLEYTPRPVFNLCQREMLTKIIVFRTVTLCCITSKKVEDIGGGFVNLPRCLDVLQDPQV